MPPTRVLYVNHTGRVSGGELSLLTLLAALSPEVEATVACPEGDLAGALAGLGVARAPLTGTDGSLKLHPRHTPVALATMSRAAAQVRSTARRRGADVVHANSIRAGLVSGLARLAGGPPVVAHVRDCLPPGAVSAAAQRFVARTASVVLANSAYTLERFAAVARPRAGLVAHSPVDLARFDPARASREATRGQLGLGADEPVLGVVGQLTPWKGQDVALRALAMLRAGGLPARLVLAGSTKFTAGATRFDNVAYLEGLHRLAGELGVTGAVVFAGEREDVPQVTAALDVALVPSWEEPFGRTVVEALAMGVPVLATRVGGPREVVREGIDGFLLDPGDPAAWAGAASRLLATGGLAARMGAAGRQRAASFSAPAHEAAVREAYARALA